MVNLLSNTLTLYIRTLISKYYEAWRCCSEESCSYQTQTNGIFAKNNFCPNCNKDSLVPKVIWKYFLATDPGSSCLFFLIMTFKV